MATNSKLRCSTWLLAGLILGIAVSAVAAVDPPNDVVLSLLDQSVSRAQCASEAAQCNYNASQVCMRALREPNAARGCQDAVDRCTVAYTTCSSLPRQVQTAIASKVATTSDSGDDIKPPTGDVKQPASKDGTSDFTPHVEAAVSNGNSSLALKVMPANPNQLIRDVGFANAVTLDEYALKIPTAKNSDTSTLGTLDGLASSTTLSWTRTWKWLNGPSADKAPFNVVGYSVQAGPQSYSFFDPTTLGKTTTSKETSALAGYWGTTWGGDYNNVLTLLKYSYQDTYAEATTKVMCRGGASPFSCVNGAIGAPTRKLQHIVTLENRVQHKNGIAEDIALSYDTSSHVTGLSIPIYLWGNGTEDKPLAFSGGVSLGWTNDPASPHKGTLQLFVGKPFSFYTFGP